MPVDFSGGWVHYARMEQFDELPAPLRVAIGIIVVFGIMLALGLVLGRLELPFPS